MTMLSGQPQDMDLRPLRKRAGTDLDPRSQGGRRIARNGHRSGDASCVSTSHSRTAPGESSGAVHFIRLIRDARDKIKN